MTSDAVIVLAWLVAAHLLSDFVLQTSWMATAKFGTGRSAWTALLWHVLVVGTVLAPLVLAYGGRGLAYLIVTVVSHLLIDRTKIALTRRSEPQPSSGVEPSAEDAVTGPALDRAWTPVPGALFILDQLAHAVVLLGAWLVLLAGEQPASVFAASLDRSLAGLDRALFHRWVLVSLVLFALAVINVRVASLFVDVLVKAPAGSGRSRVPLDPLDPRSPVSLAAAPRPEPPAAYTLRVGPVAARLEPDLPAGASAEPLPAPRLPRRELVAPARVGEAIGVIERLLIVGLVLTGAVASIGLVIAAKTLARFKQLDDREFAEYYLLGTLASVTIAVLSGLVAQAVLSLP